MSDQSNELNCSFFGCVVVSDLFFFQETVLLNPCFMFSKNLVLWFIDQVTTGT